MKRLLLTATAGFMFYTGAALATPASFYINNGVVNDVDPGAYPLQIDAQNFVNRGSFTISRGYLPSSFFFGTFYYVGQAPFTTLNTLNYTNLGTMLGTPGFRFDYSDANHPYPFNVEYAANFSNEKRANGMNAVIHSDPFLLIQAANVYSSGTLSSGDSGYIKMRGHDVNLTRGTVELLPSRIRSMYWGVDTNDLTANFNSLFVTSSRMDVTYLWNNMFYFYNFFYSFTLTNGFTAYVSIAPSFAHDYTIDVLILGTPGPGITTEVRFGSTNGPTTKSVSWFSSYTNRVTGDVLRNQLTLTDSLANTPSSNIGLQQDPVRTQILNNMETYHPRNYTLVEGFGLFTNGIVMNPVPFNPSIFDGAELFPSVTNTAWGARITPESNPVNPALAGSTWSNVFGRIEITANKALDLTSTRIQGQSFLLLESTNHFVGSTNSRIFSPFSTIKLGSTNTSMTIANLLQPALPAPSGEVEVWSGRWTNSGALGSVLYNVTIVDGRFTAESSSFVDVLELYAKEELVIADIFNVLRGAKIDAKRLTIVTNFPSSASERGELNFLGQGLVWSQTFPRLKYFTNYSQVLSSNTIYFAESSEAPWLTGRYDKPYEAFVNYGSIISHGNDTWANIYRFSGTNNSGLGPISVRTLDGALKNGAFQTPMADIYIGGCTNLTITDFTIDAGRSLTLDPLANAFLSDASLIPTDVPGTFAPNLNITNAQVWNLGAGINLTRLPAVASLLATKVMLGSYYNLDVVTRWAGKDLGCNPDGFVTMTNGAIGHLVLDGTNFSVFSFMGMDDANALYVDRLELTNWAALMDPNGGERTGIYLAPGFKLYFAQAIADGLDVSDRLNGRSGGQFCWVSGYAGAFSSTNMVYENGLTYRVNAALANDCSQDSDNDGIPNCVDPSPVRPEDLAPPLALVSWTPPPSLGGGDSGDGGDGGDDTDPKDVTEPDNGLPKLALPAVTAPYSGALSKAGTYYALFYNAQGVTVPASGFLKLTVSSSGAYSGKLQNAGASYSFTGRLKNGAGSNMIRRKGAASIKVSFVVNDPIGKLEGSVTSANWSADLIGDRQVHSAKRKSPFAGRYTMVIPGFEFKGCGAATVLVNPNGTLLWSARLGDGTKATQGSAASGDGIWPLYFSTAGGKSVVASWMQFAANDLNGKLIWIRPNLFARQLDTSASRYRQPKPSKPMIALEPYGKDCYGKLVIESEKMTTITSTVVFKNGTKATFPNGGRITLQMVPGTGLFQGTFRNPANGKPVSFQGAVVQDENYGAGSFNLNGVSGRVYLVKPLPID